MRQQFVFTIETKPKKSDLPISELLYNRVQKELTNLHSVLDTLNENLYPFPTGKITKYEEGLAIRRDVFGKLRNLEQLLYKLQELGDENNGR